MLIYKYIPDAASVAGVWSGNTDLFSGGLCRQVYVKSASSDTTFDLVLTDEDDIEVRKWTNQTGIVNDLTPFFVRGVYTLAISSASENEDFKVLICVNDG